MTKIFTLLAAAFICTTAQASDMGGFNVGANKGLFGPTAGGNGTATYRLAVPADIPALDFAKITTGTVPILQGGSGQTTAIGAFDAFSPLGAKGDTLVYNSTTGHNAKFTACADGDQIQFDSTVAGIGIKCVVPASGSGTVTAVSIAAANGFTGSSSGGATPALTIIASGCNGVCKSNATTISTATSGTDYSAGTSGNATGIVKSTTGTGALTTAIAADFPTLNQNTTGTASNVSGTPALPNGVTATTQAASDNSTKLGTTAYTDSAVAAGKGLVEADSTDVPLPINDTYPLERKAAYAYTINSVNIATTSGTITADFAINGTVITGCNGISVTSANSANTCTAANSVAIGDTVTLVTTANAAGAHLNFTVKKTRQ